MARLGLSDRHHRCLQRQTDLYSHPHPVSDAPYPAATSFMVTAAEQAPKSNPGFRRSANRQARVNIPSRLKPSSVCASILHPFRRSAMKLASLPLLTLILPLLLPPRASRAADPHLSPRPNIVLILIDDLGYECIGADGGKSYRTPNIDQLAKDGVRFEQCYAQPNCTPTRVQLLSGMSNVRNYVRFGTMEKSVTTFGNIFSQAGYATAIDRKST